MKNNIPSEFIMNRIILPCVALALGALPLRAAEPPDDVQFYRALQRTVGAARELDFTRMFSHIVRRGADMGGNDGWFKASESRYGWKWLSARSGDKTRISPKDFNGPTELFARLDRDRDGFLTASDF